jgi:uncharacterized membrane protein
MRKFLSQLDSDRIVAAIADAEKKTSGEIRVHVTSRKPDNLEERARRRFELLGMTRTADRNGVLFYVAPGLRRFHVLGDSGIHEKVGDAFWKETAAAVEEHFRRSEFTEGLVHGIARAGDLLAAHFPRAAEDVNELPDEVTED